MKLLPEYQNRWSSYVQAMSEINNLNSKSIDNLQMALLDNNFLDSFRKTLAVIKNNHSLIANINILVGEYLEDPLFFKTKAGSRYISNLTTGSMRSDTVCSHLLEKIMI